MFKNCPLIVKKEWDYIKYGDYWGGDQKLYLINKTIKNIILNFKKNYRFFNTRPYHYKVLKCSFVHFTGSESHINFQSSLKNTKPLIMF